MFSTRRRRNQYTTMSLHWKMHTSFPFTRVFVLGIILFFLGLASMVISIIAFVTETWGHYVGTGMWGGAIILASGLTAVFVSRLKSLSSVKTFMISTVIGVFASLTMLILSAGGLTLNSGFYNRVSVTEYSKRTSHLVHASLLVISVFCLSGNVLGVIVSSKYLFFEPHEKPKHRRRHHRTLSDGTIRTSSSLRGGAPNTSSMRSTSSHTPLHVPESSSRRHSDNVNANRVQLDYRRSHRRSASDQPHGNSHTHRHRQGQQDLAHSFNNSNALSSTCARPSLGRRSNHLCMDREGKENDRWNILSLRHMSTNRQGSQPSRVQMRLSGSPVSASNNVRLPTEFNEEDLPPYEAVEASRAMNDTVSSSPGDSGDESDTENSSSTDAHSYDATHYCEEGAEAVPMVDLSGRDRHDDQNSQRNRTTKFSMTQHGGTPPQCRSSNSKALEKGKNGLICEQSNITACPGQGRATLSTAGAMVVRKDSKHSDRPVLTYVNTQPSGVVGDYESLVSVSPEVCAIIGTGCDGSQNSNSEAQGNMPHVVDENFYENGPCYENIQRVGQKDEDLNPLSKSPVTSNSHLQSCVTSCTREKSRDKSSKNSSSVSVRKVPIHVLAHSSTLSTSTVSPRSSFGSTHSAFRPVGATAHSVCSPTTQSPCHLQSNEVSNWKNENSSPTGASSNDKDLLSNQTKQFKDQGAIPKSLGQQDRDCTMKESSNLSWKNIPLPLSYNHSESASNDSEEKLPSKTIPFADQESGSIIDSITVKNKPAHVESSKTSSHVTHKENTLSSNSREQSLHIRGASTISFSTPGAATNTIASSPSSAAQVPLSSCASPSIQALPCTSTKSKGHPMSRFSHGQSIGTSTSNPSRWNFQRMGGTQSLLQSRREELQNSHLAPGTLSGESRPVVSSQLTTQPQTQLQSSRPAIMSTASNRMERDTEGAAGASEAAQPLSLRSYLVNQPSSIQNNNQLQSVRQNHLVHHYPIQPQQPRLGVQLQHRRQQQHQLQQNIEVQQQQQQQQQQQLQQHDNQNQQAQRPRNGRPLFSVLL